MSKITLEQLKEQQQISSLDEYTNMDLEHEADYQRFKDAYPKSVTKVESDTPTKSAYRSNLPIVPQNLKVMCATTCITQTLASTSTKMSTSVASQWQSNSMSL